MGVKIGLTIDQLLLLSVIKMNDKLILIQFDSRTTDFKPMQPSFGITYFKRLTQDICSTVEADLHVVSNDISITNASAQLGLPHTHSLHPYCFKLLTEIISGYKEVVMIDLNHGFVDFRALESIVDAEVAEGVVGVDEVERLSERGSGADYIEITEDCFVSDVSEVVSNLGCGYSARVGQYKGIMKVCTKALLKRVGHLGSVKWQKHPLSELVVDYGMMLKAVYYLNTRNRYVAEVAYR